MLRARTDRARKRLARLPECKNLLGSERVLLPPEQASRIVELLKFEGYGIAGEELI